MLKFEKLANIGDIIKAYDFKPMSDRPDMFLAGKVIDKGMVKHPTLGIDLYMGYTVEILGMGEENRYTKGEIAYVPFEVDLMEYDNRIELIATVEEVEMVVANENEEVFH